MLRIGAVTFGGGYAMIPQMSRDFADRYGFVKREDIADLFSVAQSIPGVISVNAAVLVGYRVAGRWGALVAALGAVLPSFVTLSVLTVLYHSFIDNPYVLGAMRAIRATVVALLLSAVCKLHPVSVKGAIGWLFFVAALAVAILFPSVNVIWLIVSGGLLGLLFLRRGKQETEPS